MMNATIIHVFPRQQNITVAVRTHKGDLIEMDHSDTAMTLFSSNGIVVLEAIRFAKGAEDVVGTIHFPNPASIELAGNKK